MASFAVQMHVFWSSPMKTLQFYTPSNNFLKVALPNVLKSNKKIDIFIAFTMSAYRISQIFYSYNKNHRRKSIMQVHSVGFG